MPLEVLPFDEPALRLRDDAEAARVVERGLLEPDFEEPFEEVPLLLPALLLERDRVGDPFFEEPVLACAIRSSLSSLTTCLSRRDTRRKAGRKRCVTSR